MLLHCTVCSKWKDREGWRSVRALVSHQRGRGSLPGVYTICGLSSLLILKLALKGFLRVLRFSSPNKNQHSQIPIRRVLETVDEEPLCGSTVPLKFPFILFNYPTAKTKYKKHEFHFRFLH